MNPTMPPGMTPVSSADPCEVFARVPFMKLLGMRREFSEGGRARLVIEPRPDIGNVIGTMHGGVILTLLDVVMASAAVSMLGFTRTAVTLNLDSSFIAPGRGRLSADGEVIEHDESVAWCKATVHDNEGSLVAQALGSFRYLPFPSLSQETSP